MPKLVFSLRFAQRTIDAPEGGLLMDICDDGGVAVPFSCRSASCGVCRVAITEGAELLDDPSRDEQATLSDLAAPSSIRLACRARVRSGSGLVRLTVSPQLVPSQE